ncbi:MAG: hypothetical protein H6534_02255 [Chthonomonadaceae bacterium]|nr:hypothetical protein [Chthonomonadaceae bacterium]
MNQPKDDPAAAETPVAPGKPSDPAPKPAPSKPPAKTPAKPPATPPKAPANPKTPPATPPKTPPKSTPAIPPKAPPVTTPPEVPPEAPPTANGDAFLGQWLPDDGSKVDPSTDLLRIVRRGNRLVGQIPDPEEGYLDLRATSASKLAGSFIGSDGTRMPVTMELLSKTRLMMTVVTPDGSVETVPLRRVGKVP